MFLATFAHFVARAVVLPMRFVAARVAYADNFGRTFARGMASCTACAAHSVRTRASLLAMPRLRAHRTIIWARCAAGTVRLRSTVSANHRAYDAMMIRFRFLCFYFTAALLGPPLPGPLLTYAAALLGPPLPGPLLTCSPAMMISELAETAKRVVPRIAECGRYSRKIWANPSVFFCFWNIIFVFRNSLRLFFGFPE